MNKQTTPIPLLLAYVCTASVSAAILSPALPQITKHYHIANSAVSSVVAIFLVGYVLGQLFYGPLANYIGRVKALQTGLTINLIGVVISLIAAYTPLFDLLLLGRLITSLGAACGLSITYILINEALDHSSAKTAISYVSTAFTIGIGLAVFVGGLVTEHWSWQSCLWLLLGHGVLMLLATQQLSEPSSHYQQLKPKAIVQNYLLALGNNQLIKYALLVGTVSAFTYGYSAAAPLYATDVLQLTPSQYGYWNLVNMAAMFFSGLFAAKLVKHANMKILLITSMVGFVFSAAIMYCCLYFGYISTLVFFLASAVLYFFASLLLTAGSYFASNSLSDKASAASAMSLINMGTAAVAVYLQGLLPFYGMYSMLYTIAGLLLLCVVVSTWPLWRCPLHHRHT